MSFTKPSEGKAHLALAMHVGRVHTKHIQNGVIRRGPGRPRKEHAHEHNGNGHAVIGSRSGKLGKTKREAVIQYIRDHHGEYRSKAACFHAAMEETGATGTIKENSVAVSRHFQLAFPDGQPAPEPKLKPRRYRRDTVDKVLFAHAAQEPVVVCGCPNCRYDFSALTRHNIPAKHCPGCGVSIRTFIDQLLNLVTR